MNEYLGCELDVNTLPVDGRFTVELTIRRKDAPESIETYFPLLGPYSTEDTARKHAVAAARAFVDQARAASGLHPPPAQNAVAHTGAPVPPAAEYRRPSLANGWRITVQLDQELASRLEYEAYRLGGTPNAVVLEMLGSHLSKR